MQVRIHPVTYPKEMRAYAKSQNKGLCTIQIDSRTKTTKSGNHGGVCFQGPITDAEWEEVWAFLEAFWDRRNKRRSRRKPKH